jgi:hypothetical protein
MTKTDYERAYAKAEQELADLLAQQEITANRILNLRQTLTSLAALCKEENADFEPGIGAEALIDKMGITEDVLSILRAIYPVSLSPVEVKDRLRDLGYNLEERYQNPLATVHVILNRLKDSKDNLVEERIEGGKKVFKAKGHWNTAFRPGQVDKIARIARPSDPRGIKLPIKPEREK